MTVFCMDKAGCLLEKTATKAEKHPYSELLNKHTEFMKLKLIILGTAMYFFALFNSNAQSNSVTITCFLSGYDIYIKTINEEYFVEEKELKGKDFDRDIEVKKEIDKWLRNGYRIENSYFFAGGGSGNITSSRVTFILVKKE